MHVLQVIFGGQGFLIDLTRFYMTIQNYQKTRYQKAVIDNPSIAIFRLLNLN
jgi:hypothetical protein